MGPRDGGLKSAGESGDESPQSKALVVLMGVNRLCLNGDPLLAEIELKTRKVVWALDECAKFGNSVPNSILPDLVGETIC